MQLSSWTTEVQGPPVARPGRSAPKIGTVSVPERSLQVPVRNYSSHSCVDYAKAIEWAADQPWSAGKIGLTGISYLGLNQVGPS